MSRSLFWRSVGSMGGDRAAFAENQPGAWRVDDRHVISGIIHMLKCGGRWQDVPAAYGPPTTIYNRGNRWSRRWDGRASSQR